jgi:carbon starvation protein
VAEGQVRGKPALALITLIPLVWLIAVTFTAGVQKIFHPDPRIGFLAQANALHQKAPALEKNLDAANATGDTMVITAAQESLRTNHMLEFNNLLDAAVAGTFLVLVTAIIFLSVREWILLLSQRKPAVLHETEPVWLPDYALKEAGPDFRTAAGAAVIALGLAKELSGESRFERAQQQVCACSRACESADSPRIHPAMRDGHKSLEKIYLKTTEQRFNGVRRCC